MTDDEQCAICRRVIETTTHHLTPKDRKNSDTAEICKPCHKQIHAVFTNHELKQDYNTVDALRESERMQSFIAWIQKTDKTDIQVDESEHVRNWRR